MQMLLILSYKSIALTARVVFYWSICTTVFLTIGHYWSLQTDTPLSNWTVLSYSSASWLCGFSFDYSLQGSSKLTLQTPSGEMLWSGTQAMPAVGMNWSHATVPDKWIVPNSSRRGLQFIVNTQDSQDTVALDNIMLNFCAPCSLEQLQSK